MKNSIDMEITNEITVDTHIIIGNMLVINQEENPAYYDKIIAN